MAKVYKLKNKQGEVVYPLTCIEAVSDSGKPLAYDQVPTSGSSNFVKSGGIFDEIVTNGAAFDVTKANNGATYSTLQNAINAIPAAYRRGGMRIRYVQTSDQKYVSFVNTNKDWSSNPSDWTSGGGGDGVFDISTYNAVGSTPATYSGLTQALGANGSNVPSDERSGGMSVKYIDSTSGKYEQWRYMGTDISTVATFVNVANWQGVDETPTAGSQNLVTSGGVADAISGELGSDGNATNNTFINYSGAVVYYTGTIGSKRITNLTPGSSVIWKYGSTSESSAVLKLSFSCYNSEGTRLSYTNYQSGSTERSVTIPANTAYVTASFMSSFAEAGIYDSTTGKALYIPTLPSDGIKTEVDNLYRNFFEDEIPTTFTSNKAIGMNGKLVTVQTEHMVSDFIPVVEGDLYRFNYYSAFNASTAPYLGIAGYSDDDEDTFIYSAFPIVNSGVFPLITTIPKGVKYVRIQGIDKTVIHECVRSGWGAFHYSANLSYDEQKNGVVQPMPTVEGYPEFYYNSVVTYDAKKYLEIKQQNNSPIDRVNTVLSVDAGQKFLFDMPYVSSPNYMSYSLRLFNSSLDIIDMLDGRNTVSTKEFEIPEGVKYVSISYATGAILKESTNEDLDVENGIVKAYLDNVEYDDNNYTYSEISSYNSIYKTTSTNPYTYTPMPYTGYAKDLPRTIKVSWDVRSDSVSQCLKITFDNGIVYTKDNLSNTVSEYDIYNLIPNHTNLIEVTSKDSENVETVVLSQKIVPSGRLRMIKAGNMSSLRDIGGWRCLDGKTIDYGKVYICGSFSSLDADTKYVLFNELGINYQIDINASDNKIDESIGYTRMSLTQAVNSLTEVNLRQNSNFLKELQYRLNQGKIVVITGSSLELSNAALFLINCAMGLSESDISKNYEIGAFTTEDTSYQKNGRTNSTFKKYVSLIKEGFSGSTLSEKMLDALINSVPLNSQTGVPILAEPVLLTRSKLYSLRALLCNSYNEFSKYSLYGKTVAIVGDSIDTNGENGIDCNAYEVTIQQEDVNVELKAYVTYLDKFTRTGVEKELSIGGREITASDIDTEITFRPISDDIGKSIGLANNYNANGKGVWWSYLRDYYNCKIIPVCWSGSGYTRNRIGETTGNIYRCSYAWHESQIRKCGIRIPGSMDRIAPDVIILCRGSNDFGHEPGAKLTDGYFEDLNWVYPTDDEVTGGVGFKEGISVTIKKLREAYPKAVIVFRTMLMGKEGDSTNYPSRNSVGLMPTYNKAIREAADFFGCEILDMDKCGITYENLYTPSEYADSYYVEGENANFTDNTEVHPNHNGHRVMGEFVTGKMKDMFFDLK